MTMSEKPIGKLALVNRERLACQQSQLKNRKLDRHNKEHRQEKNHFHSSPFIAWDGEGVTREGSKQDYCYLASSTGTSLLDVNATLSTEKCLYLLTSEASKYPDAIHVVYGGSYDVNMILVDVPKVLLELLYKGETIDWQEYRITYIPRKCFTVKHFSGFKQKGSRYIPQYDRKIVLWDVIGFFQSSFVDALKKYSFNQKEIDYIQSMKVKRGTFTEDTFTKEVVPYCQKELSLLVALMEKLRSYLEVANLPIKRWDGAGAVATSLMQREHIKEHKGEIPDDVNKASQYAYGGGRIECFMYGHYEGTVYHYDINSAYPTALACCLSFSVGQWVYTKGQTGFRMAERLEKNLFILCHVKYSYPSDMPLYPFFHRDPYGQISYPPSGETWCWGPELVIALRHFPYACIVIKETYEWVTESDTLPFHFLPELYQLRKQWKSEGNGAEKVLKLGYNSLYGKTIQKLGFRKKEGLRGIPPFFQLQWAGFTTSYTRASVTDAAMQDPHNIIAIATDGIFSRVPLDLRLGDGLGEWEYHTHESMTIVQSGVYWYGKKKNQKSYYRGFDKGTVTRFKVLRAWKKQQYFLPVKTTRFITLGSALVSSEWFTRWRTWHTIDRQLALTFVNSAKRKEIEPLYAVNPSQQLVRTYAVNSGGQMSSPYHLDWENLYTPENTIEGIPESIVMQEHAESE